MRNRQKIRASAISILLLFSLQLAGQSTFKYATDFQKILERSKDEKDNLSYNRLLKRFVNNDTTLSDFDVLALMIGFTAKPEYKPYEDLSTERKIYNLNGERKYQEGLDSGLLFLKTHPLSVKTLFEIGYSYHKLGKDELSESYVQRGRRIFQAMRFSGTGRSPETPMFALGPADGQDYIYKVVGGKIGTMGSGSDKAGNFLDILEVQSENESTSFNLYFIIQHATNKMFSEEDLKKMEEVIKSESKKGKSEKKKKKK